MGSFDTLFRGLAKTITKIFVKVPATLTRLRQVVVEETDETTLILDKEVEVLISPPFPFDIQELNDTKILAQDLRCYLPAKSVEDLGFDPVPTSNVQIIVNTQGRKYRLISIRPLAGGDEMALYEMQLRG